MIPQHPQALATLEELAGSAASGSSPHARPRDPARSGPQTDRRTLLQLVAASLALGGLSGCGEPAVAPLLSQPVGDWRKDADQPLTYATTLDHDGYGRGVLVKTQGGRPVKIEGNPRHPASLGATDVFAQADVLSLYDPDRSRSVIGEGGERSLSDARSVLGNSVRTSRSRRRGFAAVDRSGVLALVSPPDRGVPAGVPRRALAPVWRRRQ
jgi:hypothetical protein